MNDATPLETLIPLRIASEPTGIPRRTLYRWAQTGKLATRVIDGVQCATLGAMLELDETRRDARNRKSGVALVDS